MIVIWVHIAKTDEKLIVYSTPVAGEVLRISDLNKLGTIIKFNII